ncbi:hypothetical protein Trydic_g15441, partial [Trypoxylus dichotomus]
RILKIPQNDKRRSFENNEKTLKLMNTIKPHKLEYLDYIMRNERRYGLLQTILQGKIEEEQEDAEYPG